MDIVYDIETFPNCFLLTAECAEIPLRWCFEISDGVDQAHDLIGWCHWLRDAGHRMVSFNGLGFDYPVLHHLLRAGRADAMTLYTKARAIIASQDDENRWTHQVYPSDRVVPQIDLFRIHHFDNKARSTSLKALEFNMRADSIMDLPYPVGTMLTPEQIEHLRVYNLHDVRQTKAFYHHTLPMLRFREELTARYGRDFTNHNDTKIGKDFFIMELERAGVACYDIGPEGRTPRQTRRPSIALKDAILPWISFEQPEFQRIVEWMRQQTITQTKGALDNLFATINGFTFVFGTGGIHGSVENETIEASDDLIIESVDVTSMYPSIAIAYRFYPEHLGPTFVEVYQHLFEERKKYPKNSPESAMLKLALNGVYGDSGNPFSVFFDPLYLLRVTLAGQLLICLLAEKLLAISTVRIAMCNTDGIEYTVHPLFVDAARVVCDKWQALTKLNLEHVRYRRMWIRDCNNYLAEYEE